MRNLPDGTKILSHIDLHELRWRGDAPIFTKKALITSDHHNEDGTDLDESMRSWPTFCNLTDWAMDNEFYCIQNGDFANVAEGFLPQTVYDSRSVQIDKLNDYRVGSSKGTVWIEGNHDHGIVDKRAHDWNGVPELVLDRVLIHHGHKYYWANYGWDCWLVGKPIIKVKELFRGKKHKDSNIGEWVLDHTYFSNKKMVTRGIRELDERGLKVMVVGHTHQPDLYVDIRRRLAILNVGDMLHHRTFGLITPDKLLLCQYSDARRPSHG